MVEEAENMSTDRLSLDFSGLSEKDADAVKIAIARGENFHGYIPSQSLGFIIRNYRALAALGMLEEPWLTAYEHASQFAETGDAMIRAVFDACDRNQLLSLKPLGTTIAVDIEGRITLFRGCAGPVHSLGMSWTTSLDRAIWYAAKHAEYGQLADPAVYATTVKVADIYCCLDHYHDDFIVCPAEAWRVDVPAKEFRLDRPR